MRYVVDASVATEVLLRTALGDRVAPMLEQGEALAPELLIPETLAVLRRSLLTGRVAARRVDAAVADLGAWPLVYIPHTCLLARAWQYRANVSAYDAFYVAAAAVHAATLVTADGRLSRAPGLDIDIHLCRRP